MFKKRIKYRAVDSRPEEQFSERKEMNKSLTPGRLWYFFRTTLLITIYFAPSIGLTFYQRWLFQSFHFPLTAVMVHLIVKYLLATLIRTFLVCCGNPRASVSWRDHIVAVAPTGLFSGIDIGFSNWGLELVTVSLYTMTKSTVIIFILFFAILFKLEKKSWSLCFIVVMISTGLIFFTYKATQFNLIGFILVLFASMSSGVRWTCVQMLLQRSKIEMDNPVDMIYHMQPWMILSVFPFALWMEGLSLVVNCQVFRVSDYGIFMDISKKVLLGAVIAFMMEISEVMVVMYTSSLTLSVAGIFKEVFILFAAVKWNGDTMSPINLFGLVVCLTGIVSHVIHKIRTTRYHKNSNRVYRLNAEKYELKESLINNANVPLSLSSDSDSEECGDSDVLFNILNRRER